MNFISSNGNNYLVEKNGSNWLINGKEVSVDLIKTDSDKSIIRSGNILYSISHKLDSAEATITVNNKQFELTKQSESEQLLKKIGISTNAGQKAKEIKAPMPGTVLKILAHPGDSVKKGDQIIVLEAMKMENVIKSQTKGEIKSILVSESQSVEKNQVLVTFQ